jgi:hypothetical protein
MELRVKERAATVEPHITRESHCDGTSHYPNESKNKNPSRKNEPLIENPQHTSESKAENFCVNERAIRI